MQNLLAHVPAAAVGFEMLYLGRYLLRETMVLLPETVLEIVPRNT
jgi:hypothetical protein